MIGKDIQLAKQLLDKGELVGIPTETVYGLAANALDITAAIKIFEAKNRPSFDPLIIHLASVGDLPKYAVAVPQIIYDIASEYSPGPVTYLLPKKDNVPDLITSGSPYVAIRIPNHPLTLDLLGQLDYPLAAPSANPFGYISPTTAKHVEEQLGHKVAYILDGGQCEVGVESTIISVEEDGALRVLRKGGLTIEELERFTTHPIRVEEASSSKPDAPGMLSSHYSPTKPIYWKQEVSQAIAKYNLARIGILDFAGALHNQYVGAAHVLDLSSNGSLNEAARNLFDYLRQLDSYDIDAIITMPVPDMGLGLAINDRLKRATFKK